MIEHVNKDRITEEFLKLAAIDSVTKDERKMADALIGILEEMGYETYEDDAGEKIGGNTGNIYCDIKGNKDVPGVMLAAHMDTVMPGIGIKPKIEDGYFRSDGTTVLGADDLAGIVSILEAIRILKDQKCEHGDIQIVFTVAEEGGLYGAKNIDYSRIYAEQCFVLDSSGQVGSAAIKAPAQNNITAIIRGKSAHAGLEPENGVNAINIAAKAITEMKLGRIDSETTANIGIIHGGIATNIVCDEVEVFAEARSRDQNKLNEQSRHMQECFENAAAQMGGQVELVCELEYPSFNVPLDSDIIKTLRSAADCAGLELKLEETGGGSDTNIINGKGIQAVNLGIGMSKVHTLEEELLVENLIKSAGFLAAILVNVSK